MTVRSFLYEDDDEDDELFTKTKKRTTNKDTFDQIESILSDIDDDIFEKPKSNQSETQKSILSLNPQDLFACLEHKRKIIELQRPSKPQNNKLINLLQEIDNDDDTEQNQININSQSKPRRPLPALPNVQNENTQSTSKSSISFSWLIDDEDDEIDELIHSKDKENVLASDKKIHVDLLRSNTKNIQSDSKPFSIQRTVSQPNPSKLKNEPQTEVTFNVSVGKAKKIDKTTLNQLKLYKVQKCLPFLNHLSDSIESYSKRHSNMVEQITSDLRKFKSWGTRELTRLYRSASFCRIAILIIDFDIISARLALIQKKITEIDCISAMIRKGDIVNVFTEFYQDPFHIGNNETKRLLRKRSLLQVKKDTLNIAFNKRFEEEKQIDKSAQLALIISSYEESKENKTVYERYFTENAKLQEEFNSWLFDQRKVEGKEAMKVLRLIRAQKTKTEKINPEDIPGFLMNFAVTIQISQKIPGNFALDYLFYFVSRAILSQCYYDLMYLSPTTIHEQDEQYIRHILSLRKNLPIELENEINLLLKSNPKFLDKAIENLSFLPFQFIPSDMIYIIERTIDILCTSAQNDAKTEIGADDLLPLLTLTILKTDIPNIHEVIFFISRLSNESEKAQSFGWSAITFEIAVEHLKELQPGE